MEKRLILASASPRRRELMEVAGYEFEIIPSDAPEIKDGFPGAELATRNAEIKAADIYNRLGENTAVIGADTVVCLGDEILGKPKDGADAFRMLSSLSGSLHSVITGYAVISCEGIRKGYCETKVKFRNLSDEEINAYVATGEPLDKAGAYGIQERASLFAEHIEGDYFNIMGLPVSALYEILSDIGVFPIWRKIIL